MEKGTKNDRKREVQLIFSNSNTSCQRIFNPYIMKEKIYGGLKMGSNCGLIDNTAVGKRMRQIRKTNGLTQEEMAEILGVNPNAVRAYERGDYGISKEVMTKIRQHFHVSIDYLLFGEGNGWEYLLMQIKNASEEDKMKALMHLVFYFAKEKERCFPQGAEEEEIIRYMKKLFENV